MKPFSYFLILSFTAILSAAVIPSCKKNDAGGGAGTQPGSSNADTLSAHLRFSAATKILGTLPTAPAGSSLKISFEDTLYLQDQVKLPVKFLHRDSTKNIAGMFVQVSTAATADFSTHYYKVPELPEMASSDTVSVFLMGIDPAGIVAGSANASVIFYLTLIPFDKNDQPLAATTRPVKVSKQKINPDGSAAECGLVLAPGDFWKWELSYIEDPAAMGQLFFYNDPAKVWGANGQMITGCCSNGNSSYNNGSNCHLDPKLARPKFFPTWFQFQETNINFSAGGSYSAFSRQINVNPAPDITDFCKSAQGIVTTNASTIIATGNWNIKSQVYKGDSLLLSTVQTAPAGGLGFSYAKGFIHQLNCHTLVLIAPDKEFATHDLISFYTSVDTSKDGWYTLN